MRIEHLNLVVTDLDATLRFYQAAFPHWSIRGRGESSWYGVPRQWLHFGDDKNYLTFNDAGTGTNRDLTTNALGLAHFAFETTNLDALAQRLAAAGFEVDKASHDVPYRKNNYFIDPNGFEVEFVEYLSDVPSERNLYQ